MHDAYCSDVKEGQGLDRAEFATPWMPCEWLYIEVDVQAAQEDVRQWRNARIRHSPGMAAISIVPVWSRVYPDADTRLRSNPFAGALSVLCESYIAISPQIEVGLFIRTLLAQGTSVQSLSAIDPGTPGRARWRIKLPRDNMTRKQTCW